MSQHEFLSPEWVEAALAIRDEYRHRVETPAESVRMNLVVTSVPFATDVGNDELHASLDTDTGTPVPELGHLDDPHLTVTVPYRVLRLVVVEREVTKLGEAFFSGEIRVSGDMSRLLLLQASFGETGLSDDQRSLAYEVAERVDAITKTSD